MDARLALRHVLAETEDLLARAELDLRRVEERVRGLQTERQGLQLALARHGDGAGVSPIVSSPPAALSTHTDGSGEPPSWLHLSRAEAVLETLLAEDRPLSRTEILERLAAAGRTKDDPDAVSAALAYLRRTGKAQRVGSGQWAVVGAAGSGA